MTSARVESTDWIRELTAKTKRIPRSMLSLLSTN